MRYATIRNWIELRGEKNIISIMLYLSVSSIMEFKVRCRAAKVESCYDILKI
jgi:hypothetical protein